MEIRIRADVSGVQKMLDSLPAKIERRVLPAALNKVAAKAKTEMTRRITESYSIQTSDVRSRLRVYRASKTNFTVVLDPFAGSRRGRSLNLIRFLEKKVTLAEAKRRRKKGTLEVLRFKIRRSGGIKPIPGAFVGNRGRTIFIREGKSRLPIKALSTIDIPNMFNTRRINKAVVDKILADLPIEVEKAIKAQMAGTLGRRS